MPKTITTKLIKTTRVVLTIALVIYVLFFAFIHSPFYKSENTTIDKGIVTSLTNQKNILHTQSYFVTIADETSIATKQVPVELYLMCEKGDTLHVINGNTAIPTYLLNKKSTKTNLKTKKQ